MSLEPTDEELVEAIDQCGGDFHLLDLRDLMRHLAPIIARKVSEDMQKTFDLVAAHLRGRQRDVTVARLRRMAAWRRKLGGEQAAIALEEAADAIARDEDRK